MKKLQRFAGNLDVIVARISLCALVLMTVAGVIMRKVVGQPFAWLEEMQLFCFVWTIFLGGSVAFRTGGQVSIDLIANRLKPDKRRILDIFCYVVTMVVLVYLTFGGWELTKSVTRKVTPYFKIKYSYIDIAAPIGCILMMIQYTCIIVKEFFQKGNELEKGGEA